MTLDFIKYQGAGNDFIIADDSLKKWKRDPESIRKICDRCRGVGGDGLILLEKPRPGQPIKMTYYNSDGSYAAMCGNGLRCAASFAYKNGFSENKKMQFDVGGEELQAEIMDEYGAVVKVMIKQTEEFKEYHMEDGQTVYKGGAGVPHAVVICREDKVPDIRSAGAKLRYHKFFAPEGTNVDFLILPETKENGVVKIRTYERGVEGETLACGTGCAASALVLHHFFDFSEKVSFLCYGSDKIEVEILKKSCNLKGVWLTGPATAVFSGILTTEIKEIYQTT
ncbi:MAG: diaminopimelate epimerase [Lentisphaeria bacterium]|nr:diaminopimelate epimerase [Lentisphaeria bacterium]